jgi:multiple sugar transport system substrate-binding protein
MPRCCRPMQKRVHDYVVADKGTAKEALDLWSRTGKVFKEEGKNLA